MEKVKKKNKNIFMVIVLMFVMLCSTFTAYSFQTFAEDSTIIYTDVLEDLQKDETFNKDDYPVNALDYSLQVIHIAESNNDELFVYVYQPSVADDIIASSINLSTEYHNKANYTNYKLTLLNKQGVFYKYKVDDFSVMTASTRCYEISSIFRAWNKDYDNAPDNDNTIDYVSYPVAKVYIFKGDEDTTALLVYDTDYIQVTDKYVGFVRYKSGTNFFGFKDYCDSHFIAFSTNKPIDKLLEADVYFKNQSVSIHEDTNVMGGLELPSWSFGAVKENYSYITEQDTTFYNSNWNTWYHDTIVKDRIQTVADFLDGEEYSNVYKCGIFNVKASYNMDETAKEYIEDKDWVLRFYESSYKRTYSGSYNVTKWENVSNVSIMRLKFETDGKVYDLGVVDNMQTGSGKPVNKEKDSLGINWWVLGPIIAALVLILIIIFFPSLVFSFIKIIWEGIKCLFKGIWWVLCLPFELFKKGE